MDPVLVLFRHLDALELTHLQLKHARWPLVPKTYVTDCGGIGSRGFVAAESLSGQNHRCRPENLVNMKSKS